MCGTFVRFARAGLHLGLVAALLSAACASPKPAPPTAASDREAEIIGKATAVCSNVARDGGLKVLEYRKWTKAAADAWTGRLLVRPESGGLSYEVDCRYKPSRDTASLVRP